MFVIFNHSNVVEVEIIWGMSVFPTALRGQRHALTGMQELVIIDSPESHSCLSLLAAQDDYYLINSWITFCFISITSMCRSINLVLLNPSFTVTNLLDLKKFEFVVSYQLSLQHFSSHR